MLCNLAIFKDINAVGVRDRGQTVCNHDHRFSLRQIVKRLLDSHFVVRIGVGGRLIQNQDRCIFQDSPRDRDPLLLAAG